MKPEKKQHSTPYTVNALIEQLEGKYEYILGFTVLDNVMISEFEENKYELHRDFAYIANVARQLLESQTQHITVQFVFGTPKNNDVLYTIVAVNKDTEILIGVRKSKSGGFEVFYD